MATSLRTQCYQYGWKCWLHVYIYIYTYMCVQYVSVCVRMFKIAKESVQIQANRFLCTGIFVDISRSHKAVSSTLANLHTGNTQQYLLGQKLPIICTNYILHRHNLNLGQGLQLANDHRAQISERPGAVVNGVLKARSCIYIYIYVQMIQYHLPDILSCWITCTLRPLRWILNIVPGCSRYILHMQFLGITKPKTGPVLIKTKSMDIKYRSCHSSANTREPWKYNSPSYYVLMQIQFNMILPWSVWSLGFGHQAGYRLVKRLFFLRKPWFF